MPHGAHALAPLWLTLATAAIAASTQAAADLPAQSLAPSLSDPEEAVRLLAVAALRKRQDEAAFESLARALREDLSDKVRAAAASGLLAYPGARALAILEEFLASEQGAQVRSSVCLELSNSAPHRDNPLGTALLTARLAEDPSPSVRLAAVRALGLREDRRALTALKRAAEKDSDPSVRREALAAHKALSKPPRAAPPKPKRATPPDYGAVRGRDPCAGGNGWCECSSGPLSPPARCLSRDDCRHRYEAVLRHQDYTCTWDKQSLE